MNTMTPGGANPIKFRATALTTLLLLAACSGNSSGPSAAGRTVGFQLATRATATAPSQAALAGQEILTAGSDTIVVTGVQLVLRQIELERVGGAVCDTSLAGDDCEELKVGATLLDLPLGAGAQRTFTVAVDTGSFGKLKFEIHKPSSHDDSTFVAQHPGFDGVSVQVTGSYNGTPFTYTSDLDVEQEYSLNPPLVVTESTGANLTLFVDLQSWFLNQTADGLLDPAQANKGGSFEGEVKSNIEASLNAFEDDNRDGHDDHGQS